MRPAPRYGVLALATVVGLLAVTATASAAPPDQADWGTLTLEGDPVDAGFLDDGLVYATTAAGPAGTAATACSADTGDADLFLVSFPQDPGCLDAIDAPGTADGVQALATAERGDLALVALPGGAQLAGPNLVMYERSDENLTERWTETVDGRILAVEMDAEGQRGAVAVRTADGNHRLIVVSAGGDRQHEASLPGHPRDLGFSDSARFLAAGGNTTEDDRTVGWVNLYDLASENDEPVIERTIPRSRAGIVTSTALTDEGQLYVGLLDGTARLERQDGFSEVSVGTDPAHVDVDADGDVAFAAAGNTTARLASGQDRLEASWFATVNGTSQDAIVRPPHLFAVAETVDGFGPNGDRLWEMRAGPVVSFNATGLGAAIATEADEGGPSGTQTSVLEGRVLHREVSLKADAVTVSPGSIVRSNTTLANTGAAIVNVTPTATDQGLRVHTEPASLDLVPGTDTDTALVVEARPDAAAGQRSVPVDLQARPSADGNATLAVNVTSAPNVTVGLAGGEVADRTVTQGQTVTLRLDLKNRGNAEADVELDLQQTVDRNWAFRVQPDDTVRVPAGAATTARVAIDVPPGAENGTENRILVQGTSQDRVSSLQVNLTVNPFEVIRLRPDQISQEMAPGETRAYDVTVENLGSVDAVTDLSVRAIDSEGEPCVPTVWGLTLGASQVNVPSRGSQPVRVEITAPAEIPVPEVENGTAGCTDDAQRPSLRVELHGISQGGSEDRSLLFANADPNLAEEPETNDQPAPGLAVLAGVLTLTATASRGAKP